MKLFNYYRNAVIFPSLFVILFSLSYAFFDNFSGGWNVLWPAILMSVVTSLIYSLIISLLSLAIFLNKVQRLNQSLVWNMITWFLLPLAYIFVFLIYEVNLRIRFDFGFGRSFIFLLIMTVPFIMGLFSTFFRFRKVKRAGTTSGMYNL
jgi:hypothetical protein